MIILVLTLILISFLQGAFLPVNLVLLALVTRGFVINDRKSYYLAFGFGLLLSYLWGYPLGSLSLIYLLGLYLIRLIRKAHFSSHPLITFPLCWVFLAFDQAVRSYLFGSNLNFWLMLPVAFLILPIYIMVRFWEERFIPKTDFKLKVTG